MTMNTCEQFAQDNRGRHYNDIRESLTALDWDGIYPEVDRCGLLTGGVVDAASQTHAICDVTQAGVWFGEHCSDAMVIETA